MHTLAWGVIGAAYGDEGKGRTVDDIVAGLGSDAVVVRTNGGAQAGHTVVTPDGRRHVFHHVGSGTFAGAATHLSRFFVSHPMSLMQEVDALADLGATPAVSADPRGYVTTPWDMMVNQALEVSRGGGRHGSCGYGLGETVGRCEDAGFPLTVADLSDPGLRDRLVRIRDGWLPARLDALEIGEAGRDFLRMADSEAVLDRFLDDCAMFAEFVSVRSDASLGDGPMVVFEAAQGLLLDQVRGAFPFVTRSNTGVANMVSVAREAGIASLRVAYATRCYVTRHGRGPMIDERPLDAWFDIVDPTNAPNDWQETIRHGLLDLGALREAIVADLADADGMDIEWGLSLSCLDQTVGDVPMVRDGAVWSLPAAAVPAAMALATGARWVRTSCGPSRTGALPCRMAA